MADRNSATIQIPLGSSFAIEHEDGEIVQVPMEWNPKMDFDLNIAAYEYKKEIHEKEKAFNNILSWLNDNLSSFNRPDLGRAFDLTHNQIYDIKIEEFMSNLTTKSKHGELRHDTPATLARLTRWCAKQMPNSHLNDLLKNYMAKYYPVELLKKA